jgi:hypothetical protein
LVGHRYVVLNFSKLSKEWDKIPDEICSKLESCYEEKLSDYLTSHDVIKEIDNYKKIIEDFNFDFWN